MRPARARKIIKRITSLLGNKKPEHMFGLKITFE
jgi:hypothetical protein